MGAAWGTGNQGKLTLFAMFILMIVFYFESMKSLAYLSIIALFSLTVSFIYIFKADAVEMYEPKVDKAITMFNPSGIVYFFGTSIFVFEGNSIVLEIYHQADNSKVEFFTTLVASGSLLISLIIMMGTMSYLAFAQYTKSLILLNLEPG